MPLLGSVSIHPRPLLYFLAQPLQAAEVLEVCRSRGVPLLINDRVDVALAVGADGVHIGQVRAGFLFCDTQAACV